MRQFHGTWRPGLLGGLVSLLAVMTVLSGPAQGQLDGERGRLPCPGVNSGIGPIGPSYLLYRTPRYYYRGEGSTLRYRQRFYPLRRYFTDRERYPHTYAGQFGDPLNTGKLNLRFHISPGLSLYSDYAQEGMYGPATPAEASPDSEQYQSGVELPREIREAPRAAPQPLPPPARAEPRDVRSREPVTRRRQPARPLPVRLTTPSADEERAWSLLREGEAEDARYAFASVALAHPDNSRPKVGFALSASIQGDFSEAALAMRRALRVNPILIKKVPVDEELEPRLHTLIETYRVRSDHHPAESLFMIAAIQVLLNDTDAAADTIRTIERSQIDVAILRLMMLLERPVPDAPMPPEGRPLGQNDV